MMEGVMLEQILLQLPERESGFARKFEALLAGEDHRLGSVIGEALIFKPVQPDFLPRIGIDFHTAGEDPSALFLFSDGSSQRVVIENRTGETRTNPYAYQHLALETMIERLGSSGSRMIGIDHAGFNLPWLAGGVHPEIRQLREVLAGACLYHLYPSGEPWDFILPGIPEEITGQKPVDYTTVRRPKFEIVSFENASMPLLQFDVGVNQEHEQFSALFPEAIHDPDLHNIWVYLENPYGIDLCLVINEFDPNGDWSEYFKDTRLRKQGNRRIPGA